jgi:hypothetical protein
MHSVNLLKRCEGYEPDPTKSHSSPQKKTTAKNNAAAVELFGRNRRDKPEAMKVKRLSRAEINSLIGREKVFILT